MYYIRLTETNEIVYYCRNCGNEDSTITIDNVVVSHTALHQKGGSHANVVNKYTKLDPTLPRISTILCPNSECPCNRNHNPMQYADRAAIVGSGDESETSGLGAATSATTGLGAATSATTGLGAATSAATGEDADAVPREVIYLRYDDIQLKYIYLCAVCNTIWNTEHI
jgi:hypothetical protein